VEGRFVMAFEGGKVRMLELTKKGLQVVRTWTLEQTLEAYSFDLLLREEEIIVGSNNL
jgi:hypothetical protein